MNDTIILNTKYMMDGVRLLLGRHTRSINIKYIQYVLGLIMKKYDEFDADCTIILQLTFYRCHEMIHSAKCDAVMIDSILPVVFNLYAKYIDDDWWTDCNKHLACVLKREIEDVNATESCILRMFEFNLNPQPEHVAWYKSWHEIYSAHYAHYLEEKEWELHIMMMRNFPDVNVNVTTVPECKMNIDSSWELINDKPSTCVLSDFVDFVCVEAVDMK